MLLSLHPSDLPQYWVIWNKRYSLISGDLSLSTHGSTANWSLHSLPSVGRGHFFPTPEVSLCAQVAAWVQHSCLHPASFLPLPWGWRNGLIWFMSLEWETKPFFGLFPWRQDSVLQGSTPFFCSSLSLVLQRCPFPTSPNSLFLNWMRIQEEKKGAISWASPKS